ncbi:flagellar brake protein [Azomonas macrocytogenes]|uniref:C-di-GMP-binding flagellar brake protein YcgR n=1 Tax=Azomonas macrocytogenes TaxID=69962 RepID=A0A839T7D7_AZOMA|nr:c-di-GMP-binding flagellar brake protein YcgR [Azomonas macrocytogenes]
MSNPFSKEEGPRPPQILASVVEIVAALRPLQANHTPLTIRFLERGSSYRSYLIDIDREEGYLMLDEVIPSDGERHMRNGEYFKIEAFHEGARILWENRQAAIPDEVDEAPCHWVKIPQQLSYHQRRNAYRAILTFKASAKLTDSRSNLALEGQLIDISVGGCRLKVDGPIKHKLQAGTIYEKFFTQLPFGNIEIAVELRHFHHDEARNHTLYGFRFHLLDGFIQRKIELFVNQLQKASR